MMWSVVGSGLVVLVALMVVAVVTPVLAERTPRARAFVHRRSVAGRRPGGMDGPRAAAPPRKSDPAPSPRHRRRGTADQLDRHWYSCVALALRWGVPPPPVPFDWSVVLAPARCPDTRRCGYILRGLPLTKDGRGYTGVQCPECGQFYRCGVPTAVEGPRGLIGTQIDVRG